MKNTLLTFILITIVVLFSYKAFALTRVSSINVDFDNHKAVIHTFGYYVQQNGDNMDTGESSDISVNNPAFDQTINELQQLNALDLDVVINVLTNGS